MDRIDKYINSIYKDISNSSKETEELKQEMRNHLNETVKELQECGISEEESVSIALERFGEEFQIRNELNQVLKFQKVFARKILIASLVLLGISAILFITSLFVSQGYRKRYRIMNDQIELIEKKLVNEGITSVDTYLKEIFKDEKNNQFTYIAIKELPQNFDNTKNDELFPGEIKYSYPEKIKDEYYWNRFGHEVVANNIKYFLETGVKTSANTDSCSLYIGLAILTFVVCWVLWIIWSIINVSRYRKLTTKWCMLLILTGIIGYFIFLISVNPNNVANNKKITLYVSIFCFTVIALVVYYILSEPYRFKSLCELIF
ncbi:permease prefix domain 1-containing protein [Clostridium sp. ZS2-4]|uniref:permease prefix domain 1-containing protein n=1 Tax=Clostridium sp. ZS2-4 TaxID=2987703 RepID=UPI00227D5653|nr:permease prefix domain 1-containing protein [Clostridium sp. ZS2-4]MCY6354494.1 permease prefix domain 1-containing protein [Clostridium sp. ZS2-4]